MATPFSRCGFGPDARDPEQGGPVPVPTAQLQCALANQAGLSVGAVLVRGESKENIRIDETA